MCHKAYLYKELVYGLISLTNHCPDSNVRVVHMGPTWVLSAPGGPYVGPTNLAIRVLPTLGRLVLLRRQMLLLWCSGFCGCNHCNSYGRVATYLFMRCLSQFDSNEIVAALNCIVFTVVKTSGTGHFLNSDIQSRAAYGDEVKFINKTPYSTSQYLQFFPTNHA